MDGTHDSWRLLWASLLKNGISVILNQKGTKLALIAREELWKSSQVVIVNTDNLNMTG